MIVWWHLICRTSAVSFQVIFVLFICSLGFWCIGVVVVLFLKYLHWFFFRILNTSSASCKSFVFTFNVSCNWKFLFLESLFSSFNILSLFWKSFFSDSDFSFWDFRSCNVLVSSLIFMLSVSFILLLLTSKLLLICSSSFIFLSVFSEFVVKPSSSSAFVLLFLRSVFKLLIFVLSFCIYWLTFCFSLSKLFMVCCFEVFSSFASVISLLSWLCCL